MTTPTERLLAVLLPCPWCQCDRIMLDDDGADRHGYSMYCDRCYASGPGMNMTAAQAVDAWSSTSDLTSPAATKEAVERLTEAVGRVLTWAHHVDGVVVVREDYFAGLSPANAECRAALAASGHAPTPGWQPIETAPRDGTHVLVMLDGNLPPTSAHWFGPADWPGLRSGGWYLSVQQHEGPRLHPTHWQPLPEPPSMIAASGHGNGGEG